MNLLQRRLFAEFSKVFALSLAVLLLFILMGQAMRLRDMLLGLELGMGDTLRLFAYLTPSLLQYIMPVACMLAVFLTFLRMSSDRELIALKAGGVSLYQMLPAPLLFSCLCTLFSLWVTLFLVGWGRGIFVPRCWISPAAERGLFSGRRVQSGYSEQGVLCPTSGSGKGNAGAGAGGG